VRDELDFDLRFMENPYSKTLCISSYLTLHCITRGISRLLEYSLDYNHSILIQYQEKKSE